MRTQAKRLGIDLAEITPTGKNGQITVADLDAYAAKGKVQARSRSARPKAIAGRSDQLRGPRRAMAQSMSKFRDEVALCTLFDDADIHDWINKRNIMRAGRCGGPRPARSDQGCAPRNGG